MQRNEDVEEAGKRMLRKKEIELGEYVSNVRSRTGQGHQSFCSLICNLTDADSCARPLLEALESKVVRIEDALHELAQSEGGQAAVLCEVREAFESLHSQLAAIHSPISEEAYTM